MSRPATSRLKVNPPLGMRPSLEFRRLHELHIDPSYQRSIKAAASQTLIRKIAMYWDWSLCQPLAIAKRPDGTLKVVDGQHRLEAARLRRDIDDLPCVVTAYPSAGDEAAAFVALNQQRRPLNKMDLFKAALAAEDDDALAVAKLIEEAGLKIAPHTNYTAWKPGMVSNIGAIVKSHTEKGARPTGMALKALADGFHREILRYAGTIYPGLVAFVADELRTEGKVDTARLTRALQSATQKGWVALITREMATGMSRREVAAKKVVSVRYRLAAADAPPARFTPPQARPEPIQPPSGTTWCEQCDQRVSGPQVARCTSSFCKAKAKAA